MALSISSKKFPHFGDLTINFETEAILLEGAFDLIGRVKPEWKREDYKTKPFNEGLSNQLLGVYSSTSGKKDMVLVRVYGKNTDQIIDRQAEIRNMNMFFQHGCGPIIYATFANGIAYSFIPGEILTVETVIDDQISQLVIKMFAKMHKMETGEPKTPGCWKRMRKFWDISPDGFPDDPVKAKRYLECKIPSKAQLKQEIDDLEAALSNIGSPIVFAHNDMLLANAILDRKENKVTFIDYEFGDYNYQAFDIGNHFNEFTGVADVMEYDKYYPDEQFQKQWLKRYLQVWLNKSAEEIFDYQVHDLYVQVNKFALASNLTWGIWSLVQARFSLIDFDYIDYAMQRLNEYLKKKEERLAMK